MTGPAARYTVFTKHWKGPLPEVAATIKTLGFDGVELPIRPDFQVEPDTVGTALPEAARVFADHGLTIDSVAGPTDEATIATCAEAGVRLIRICCKVVKDETYLEAEARHQREFDALVPLLDKYGVVLGVQNHCDRQIPNALGLRALIGKYDPKHIAAVWDPAHCALNGEMPNLAIDIIWSHLCLVNLKNAFWQRTNGPEAENVEWKKRWTTGRQGLCSWPEVARVLKERGYDGPLCLSAEFADGDATERLIAEDIAYAKSLFG